MRKLWLILGIPLFLIVGSVARTLQIVALPLKWIAQIGLYMIWLSESDEDRAIESESCNGKPWEL